MKDTSALKNVSSHPEMALKQFFLNNFEHPLFKIINLNLLLNHCCLKANLKEYFPGEDPRTPIFPGGIPFPLKCYYFP